MGCAVDPRMMDHLLTMLGPDADRRAAAFILDDVVTKVKRYCRIRTLHPDLRSVAVEIAMNRYRGQNVGSVEDAAEIASISDGEQSISYRSASSGDIIPHSGFTQGEMSILNEYRKLWW